MKVFLLYLQISCIIYFCQDHMLAELMTNNKEWIVTYHEHDSLLENVREQELTEDEKKAAWEDYEDEKKGISKGIVISYHSGASEVFSPQVQECRYITYTVLVQPK